MAFTNAEGRQELLDALAGAVDQLALALAALGEAYEQLDDATADRLEADLFGPVQAAYGRAKRTHVQFADRHGRPAASFAPRTAGVPSTGAKGFVEAAVGAARAADSALATLQDSMLPVEVGDAELRAELTQVREGLGDVPVRARELLRTLGR